VHGFEEVLAASSRTRWATIWERNLHRELVAETRERLERSRLLLYFSKQLLRSNQSKAGGIIPAHPYGEETPMDRAMLLEHLALAEEHIQLGSQHIARQQQIIEQLEAHGRNTFEARRMLQNFEDAHAPSLAHRGRIKTELELN